MKIVQVVNIKMYIHVRGRIFSSHIRCKGSRKPKASFRMPSKTFTSSEMSSPHIPTTNAPTISTSTTLHPQVGPSKVLTHASLCVALADFIVSMISLGLDSYLIVTIASACTCAYHITILVLHSRRLGSDSSANIPPVAISKTSIAFAYILVVIWIFGLVFCFILQSYGDIPGPHRNKAAIFQIIFTFVETGLMMAIAVISTMQRRKLGTSDVYRLNSA